MKTIPNYQSLTVKQANFAQAWYETGNKSEALRQAYDVSKWTDKSINERASALSKHDKVLARFKELQLRAQKASDVTRDRVIAEYSIVAFANLYRMIPREGKDGKLCFDHLTGDERRAIGTKAKDKIKALGDLARILGIFEADNEQLAGSTRSLEEREKQHQRLMKEKEASAPINRGEKIEKELDRKMDKTKSS